MEKNYINSGFLVRLLAYAVDEFLFLLPTSAFLYYLSTTADMNKAGYYLIMFLVIYLLPIAIFNFFYKGLFSYYFGGNIGKLLTGLRVTNESGQRLSLKRNLFRYTVGYSFSFALLGLGFLAIIKDPQNLGWDDKTVGSRVITVRNLWPLALTVLIIIIGVNALLLKNAVNNFSAGLTHEEIIKTFTPTPTPSPNLKLDQENSARSFDSLPTSL